MKRMVIKLDHDPYAPRLTLRALISRARRAGVRVLAMSECRSPSGKGWHRVLHVSPAPRTAMEVVALQLLFGSDPWREAYCLNRARHVDAGTVRGYWARQDSWDVLYRRPIRRHGTR